MITPNKLPPLAFLAKQRELGKNVQASRNVTILELEKMFGVAFRLCRTSSVWVSRLENFLRTNVGHTATIFDHTTHWMHNDTQIIVTQPYWVGSFPESVEIQFGKYGVEVVDLNEWAFYYPGQASCWGLVIPRQSRAVIQAYAKTSLYGDAAHIFHSKML